MVGADVVGDGVVHNQVVNGFILQCVIIDAGATATAGRAVA